MTIPASLTPPADYYNRHADEEAKGYDEHLLIAGRIGQSAEINEIQSRFKSRLKALGDHLLKDGDIKTGGDLVLSAGPTGYVTVLAEAAEIWLAGAERVVAERTFNVFSTGTVDVGVYLLYSIVDVGSGPDGELLRDPAVGLRPFGEPGAARLKITATWGYVGDGQPGEFYSVHRIVNGVLQIRSETPESNAVATAISRYDRQSTGGSYVVDGFRVTAIPEGTEALQTYSLSAGTARVTGAEITTSGGQTLEFVGAPDTETIDGETHISTGISGQVITVYHPPIANLDSIKIEMLVTDLSVTRSSLSLTDEIKNGVTAYLDVTTVIYVKQGAVTFTPYNAASPTTPYDYRRVGDTIAWNSGAPVATAHTIPANGSTFLVKFQYRKEVVSTATVSADGRTVTVPEANVVDTEIDLRYAYNLPRIDRVILRSNGNWDIVRGISARYGSTPAYPVIPSDSLGLASIYQTWISGSRRVVNDANRVVSMARLEAHDRDIQTLYQLVSANNLQNDLAAYTARENLGRRGVFVDPFLNDFSRDSGFLPKQTAQISGGILTLGVAVTRTPVSLADIVTLDPTGIRYRVSQDLSSDSMQINPYLVFTAPKSYAYLSPWFGYFSVSQETVLPPTYVDVYEYRTEKTWDSWKDGWEIKEQVGEEEGGQQISTRTEEARWIPQTDVQFVLTKWGSNENLVRVTIDGREIDFEARIP